MFLFYLHFMRRNTIIFVLLISSISSTAQPRTSKLLSDVFGAEKDSLFQSVIQQPEIYRYQIIYTQVNRDKNNDPSFTNYYFNYDSLQYFIPGKIESTETKRYKYVYADAI